MALLRQHGIIRQYEDEPELPSRVKKKLSEELGVAEAAPAPETQDQRYARELQEARTGAERQLAESKAASERAAFDIEQKSAASRAAAEATRKSAQTLKDNSQTDLTSSGDPIVVAGGGAQVAAVDDLNAKKKIRGGGISAQVGINV